MIVHSDAVTLLAGNKSHFVWLDPPFNQGKKYGSHKDRMSDADYLIWMLLVIKASYDSLHDGGYLALMHRDKYIYDMYRLCIESGFSYRSTIIWQKMTSPTPQKAMLSKRYQPILLMQKGQKGRVFNHLRIDPPLPSNYKHERLSGMRIDDVWTDIRELTSGYFAGKEPLRNEAGERVHLQQMPKALILRFLLMVTMPDDTVIDPFAGTGTTAIVASQIGRNYICGDNDESCVEIAQNRLISMREIDRIEEIRHYYRYTENLDAIWRKESQ